MTRQRNQHGGFTLLELLMVVIIIAILASVALPQYIKASEKARGSEALQALGAIRSAQARYRAQSPNGLYTNNLGDLDITFPVAARYWGAVNMSAPGVIGGVSFPRSAGTWVGRILGLSYGSGNVCGNFEPVIGAANIACVAD